MPGVPLAAWNAVVRIGATTPAVFWARVWRIRPKSRWLPTPSFEGGGYMNQVRGLKQATVIIEFWLDEQQSPYEPPINFVDGTDVADISLHVDGPLSPFWDIPHLSIEGPDHDADVELEHKIVVTGMTQGLYFYPIGNPTAARAAYEAGTPYPEMEKALKRREDYKK